MRFTFKKHKTIIFIILSSIVLSISLFVNPASKISDGGDNNFDWYSDSIIFSDLQYNKYFEKGCILLKSLNPDRLIKYYGGEASDYENAIKNEYNSETNSYKQSDFGNYPSNIVIQRYFFRFIDSLLNTSNSFKTNLFYTINCVLMAIMLSIILLWISKIFNNYYIGIVIVLALATCAPNFLMYGKNLYWCAWTMFFPTAMMALTLMSNSFQKTRRKIALLSFVAFFVIFIKCLFYFEFITVVMISMMIPVIYYLISESASELSLKNKIQTFLIVSAFALLAFLLVNLIKLIFLKEFYGNTSDAINSIVENFTKRITGNVNHENSGVVESAKVSYLYVIFIMILKPFLNIKHIVSMSQFALIGITFICSLFVNYLAHKFRRSYKKKIAAWTVCTWISFLAPLSWMLLAKPHNYIHHNHCTINWFNIFDIMAISLILITVVYLFRDLCTYYKSEKDHKYSPDKPVATTEHQKIDERRLY